MYFASGIATPNLTGAWQDCYQRYRAGELNEALALANALRRRESLQSADEMLLYAEVAWAMGFRDRRRAAVARYPRRSPVR